MGYAPFFCKLLHFSSQDTRPVMSSFLNRTSLAALTLLVASAANAHAQPGQMTVGQAAAAGNLGAGRIMSLPNTAGFGGMGLGGGYNPYFPGDFNAWAGGTLTGAANLVGAQGQLMKSQQDA